MNKKLFLFIAIFLVLVGWTLASPRSVQGCGEKCYYNWDCDYPTERCSAGGTSKECVCSKTGAYCINGTCKQIGCSGQKCGSFPGIWYCEEGGYKWKCTFNYKSYTYYYANGSTTCNAQLCDPNTPSNVSVTQIGSGSGNNCSGYWVSQCNNPSGGNGGVPTRPPRPTPTPAPNCDSLCQGQGYTSGTCRRRWRGCGSNEVNIGRDNCRSWERCCCRAAPTPTPRPTATPRPTSTPTPPPPTPTPTPACVPPEGPALNQVDQSCQTSSSYTKDFSWAVPVGTLPIDYRFEISENSDYSSPLVTKDTTNTSIAWESGWPKLNTATRYYWRVRAVNACGCSYGTEYNNSVSSPCTGWVPQSEITIYARGTPLAAVFPHMELRINNTTVASFDVTGTLDTYSYTHASSVTSSQVKVAFTNDAYLPPQDRNLFVDKIVIGTQTYETEAPSVYSTGTWTSPGGCNDDYKQSEWLHCNGYFRY